MLLRGDFQNFPTLVPLSSFSSITNHLYAGEVRSKWIRRAAFSGERNCKKMWSEPQAFLTSAKNLLSELLLPLLEVVMILQPRLRTTAWFPVLICIKADMKCNLYLDGPVPSGWGTQLSLVVTGRQLTVANLVSGPPRHKLCHISFHSVQLLWVKICPTGSGFGRLWIVHGPLFFLVFDYAWM